MHLILKRKKLNFLTLSSHLMVWADFLPILLFIYRYNQIKPNAHIFSFLTISFSFQIISLIATQFGIETLKIAFVYDMISSILITHFAFRLIKNRQLLVFALLTYIVSSIVIFLNDLNFYGFVSTNFYILIISVLTIGLMLKNYNLQENHFNCMFFLSLIFYYSGSLFVFFVLPNLKDLRISIWGVHNLIEAISKFIILVTLWKLPLKSLY